MNSTSMEIMGTKKIFSGSTLKLIALITMLIDHVAAVLLVRILIARGYDDTLYTVYTLMRKIGRVAFPIFIFLMIEGFDKTRSRTKYILRMAAFAVISEIPFDLAFSAKVLEFHYQNIFFTLLIGMLVMWGIDYLEKHVSFIWLQLAMTMLLFIVGMQLAELLRTDYGAKGIMGIVVMYLFRRYRLLQVVSGALAFLWELPAPLAFLPIAFYNGKRGLKLKYIFYVFYPLHLIIIYLICMAMGLHGWPVV